MSEDEQRTVRREIKPDGTEIKEYASRSLFGALTKHPIVSGVLTTLSAGGIVWLLSVGGFVTNAAYAEDQGKLDQIITLIMGTDAKQTSARKHAVLDAQVTNAKQRIEELTLYIEAAPDSPLASTRTANIRRLGLIISDAELEKAELMRQEAEAAGEL